MARDLTPRQVEVLDFVCETIVRTGTGPTLKEIGERFGFTSNRGAETHLTALTKKGYLIRHERSYLPVRDREGNTIALAFIAKEASNV